MQNIKKRLKVGSVAFLGSMGVAAPAFAQTASDAVTIADANAKVTELTSAMTSVSSAAFLLVGALIGTGLLVWAAAYVIQKAKRSAA